MPDSTNYSDADFKELNLLVRSLAARLADVEQIVASSNLQLVSADFQEVLHRIRKRVVAMNILLD
jgi:hypothetical protein